MQRQTWVTLAASALTALGSTQAGAQGPAVRSAPNTQELGIDAGATIGLGDQSSIQIALPAARARLGFFTNNNTRWSIEPAAGLTYTKVEDNDGVLFYNLELGALYHFSTPSDVYSATRATVGYVRPFIGVVGTAGGANDDSEVSAGAGLGIKVPLRQDLAWRLEGNLGYGFSNQAVRLGAFAGLSFFTRNLTR